MEINIEPDEEYALEGPEAYTFENPVVDAIKDLKYEVVEAFRHHDRDLRAEVEKVNRQIRWLLGGILLLSLTTAYHNRRRRDR